MCHYPAELKLPYYSVFAKSGGVMNIHIIIHEEFEGPNFIDSWINNRGYQVSYSRVYLGDMLPLNMNDFDGLIVLGGPQSPDTTKEECAYFHSKEEQSLILHGINGNKMVMGVCLGAQLIGEALGAKYERSPEKEIGYFPIQLSKDGIHDSSLDHFNLSELVGHWHDDMPGLTESAKVLASSKGCPRQIIRYSNLVYGFQCHLEFIASELPSLIEHSTRDFTVQNEHIFIQSELEILNTSTSRMNQLLGDFLDNLIAKYRYDDCKEIAR